MAYNKTFNPDALPAFVEPEQAAQALSNLQGNRKPISRPNASKIERSKPPSPPARISPAAVAAQQSWRPQQNSHDYGQPNRFERLHSPAPNSHGYGSQPQPTHLDRRSSPRPVPNHYVSSPRTPMAPNPDPADLYPLFQAANASRNGALTMQELGSALVNGDWTPFDPSTIKSLMMMFSTSPPGQPQGPTITYPEFQNLWRFLAAWRELFERFDEDRSGRISLSEFSSALVTFGYRLSQPFIGLLYTIFNEKGQRQPDARRGSREAQGLSFDLFVQACVSLKRMTDVFKGYDDDRDGYVTLSFEEFLTEILKLRE